MISRKKKRRKKRSTTRKMRIVTLGHRMDPDRVISLLKARGFKAEYQNAIKTNASNKNLAGYR